MPFALPFTVLLAAGCATVENDLAHEHANRLRSWDEAVAVAREGRAPAILPWDKAVGMMLRHNPELAQARLDRVNIDRDARRVWRDLLPYFTFNGFRSGRLNANDWRGLSTTQFTTYVSLYLERFAELPRNLYGVALTKARSDAVWRQAVKLHMLDLYTRCEALAAAQNAFAQAGALSDLMERHPDYFRGRDRDDQRLLVRGAESRLHAAEDALRDMLAVPHEALRVDMATLPAWADKGAQLLAAGLPQEGNAAFIPDQDWIALMAIESAGAIARRRGVELQAWPSLNAYLSPPNVGYSAKDGFGAMDWSQTSLNVTAYWSPNWLLDARDQAERAKDDRQMMVLAFGRQTDDRLRQLEKQARLLREADRQIGDLDKRIAAVPGVAARLAPRKAAELFERQLRWRAEADEARHLRRAGLAQLWFASDNAEDILPHEALVNP